MIATATLAAAAAVYAAVPAGAGKDGLSAELEGAQLDGVAKRGVLALDVTGSAGPDRLTIRTLAGDVIVSVPSPQTVDGPDECTQDSPQQFTCDSSLGVDGVRAFMGPGGDRVNAKRARKVTNQYGGAQNDTLLGGKRFDFLNGQSGGNDTCKGKRGPETIKKCE
jgi:hypothetical protein